MIDFLNGLSRWLSPLWEMSVIAAYAAAVVIILRLLLKKRAPKQVLCLLWLVVFARLLIPASLESPLSIVPDALPGQDRVEARAPGHSGAGNPVTPVMPQNPAQNQTQNQPGNDKVTPVISNQSPSLSVPEGMSPTAPATEASAPFPWQAVAAGLWLAGAAALGGSALVSYLRLRRRLFDAIRAKDGAWEHPAVDSPFILGIVRPRIYLPAGLAGQPRQFILCHERAHLRRFDHIVKPVCWVALALHWFNPLVWAAFLLMSRDIESACDEAVVRQLGSGVKADYSYTLLALATGRRLPAPCPLAFDEGDARGRIRNVLSYRRPALWAIVISAVAAALAAVCLLTDPVAAKGSEGDPDPDAAGSLDPDASDPQDMEGLNSLLDPWMKEFLDGERTFSSPRSDSDRVGSINDLRSFYYGDDQYPVVALDRLAIIDLDRDGLNEMVVWPSVDGDTSIEAVSVPGYLILRRQGDTVYGYNPSFRAFSYLKADGTFEWCDTAFEGGTATMSFNDNWYELDNVTWFSISADKELYFVEGQEVTREEFLAAGDAQDAKPEPIWYTYQDGVLSVWAPTLTPLGRTNPDYDTGEAVLWLDEGSKPWLEWNGATTKLSAPPMSPDEYGNIQCRDFDGDGQDEVVITWYFNGFPTLALYEWDGDRPQFSAEYDTQQLLVRFNQNNVAGYNKDTRTLAVTYAHVEGNDNDPDYYRHYVTGDTTLPEGFFEYNGYENIRDGYLYAYAYKFHLFYWTGSAYYLDFDFCLADETMQTLDYVDIPMDENQELSPYYAGYHYMAYQPVGAAAFYLSYDGTDWRVQEWDELVMDGQNGGNQAGELNPIYTAAPLDAPIADMSSIIQTDPDQWYKVAELTDDMIWMFSRDYGAETLLRWDGNLYMVFDRTAHTSYGIMPRLKKLSDDPNFFGLLAVISNVDKGTGLYIEELVVYDLDAAGPGMDYTHDWRPLMDDFNENVSYRYDKNTRTLTFAYLGQTVETTLDANDETYLRIEHDYPGLEQEDLRVCITGEFVYYQFDQTNSGDIWIELPIGVYVGNEVVPMAVSGSVIWTLRFNGGGFDTVPGSCVVSYPGYTYR